MITENVERFYQKKTIPIKAANQDVVIDFDTPREWDRVVEVIIYGDANYVNNRNCQFTQPFKINNTEFYPVDFDTYLLFPRKENERYRMVNEEANGSKVEGKIVDPSVTGFAAYELTIVLVLERDIRNG
ncbi:MAG: hypothetical protein KDC05_06260 [Bacteroidales bacterium]|nr:hypothetical protein [Bacteroidales bacterium]